MISPILKTKLTHHYVDALKWETPMYFLELEERPPGTLLLPLLGVQLEGRSEGA